MRYFGSRFLGNKFSAKSLIHEDCQRANAIYNSNRQLDDTHHAAGNR